MNENTGRTLVCSVVFLDIVEYTKKPVAEQLHIKQGFNRLLRAALEHVAPRDRVVLDTGDGAALTFLGDPEDALFVAISLRDSVRSDITPVRLGVEVVRRQVIAAGDEHAVEIALVPRHSVE